MTSIEKRRFDRVWNVAVVLVVGGVAALADALAHL